MSSMRTGSSLSCLRARDDSSRTKAERTESADHSTITTAALCSLVSITAANSLPAESSLSHQTCSPPALKPSASCSASGRFLRA